MPTSRTEMLTERSVGSRHAMKVDQTRGVIHDVRILSADSRNGRTYTPDAMIAAAGMYEGCSVNFDHSNHRDISATRSVSDRAGWLENVRYRDGALVGDLHLLLADPRTAKIMEAAERRPELFGLSHAVEGTTRRENGRTTVEAITRVASVDLVADPATTRSLFESGSDAAKFRESITSPTPSSDDRPFQRPAGPATIDSIVQILRLKISDREIVDRLRELLQIKLPTIAAESRNRRSTTSAEAFAESLLGHCPRPSTETQTRQPADAKSFRESLLS